MLTSAWLLGISGGVWCAVVVVVVVVGGVWSLQFTFLSTDVTEAGSLPHMALHVVDYPHMRGNTHTNTRTNT